MAGEQILLVEDDEASQFIYTTVLEHHGYTVRQARTAEEGLRMVREQRPDLVVMDVGLPGQDGFSLTRQIRADPDTRDTLVVAVTVHAFDHDRAAAVDAGCDYFIPKPLQPSDLVAAISRLLERAPGGH